MEQSLPSIPVIVDLDGTLIHSDMLHESVLRLMRDRPLRLLMIPLWIAQGKATLKRAVAQDVALEPASLPFNLPLIDWLKQQRDLGRRLVLCTASDRLLAQPIADHLDLFDEVFSSDGKVNLAGNQKALMLIERFGEKGFDYVGNSGADIPVWKAARSAIVVNASPRVRSSAIAQGNVEKELPRSASGWRTHLRMLRVHQWLKNLLLFVPLLAAHDLLNASAWENLLLAFVAFCLCASSVYIANDLLDLESDRLHPRKRLRPFASGAIPLWLGVVVAPVLLCLSLWLGSLVNSSFLVWLVGYFLLTCLYSWLLKRLMLIDSLTLAFLYTLRIIAGAAAAGQIVSFWLLAFSVFLFLSLAFVKRYAELELQRLNGKMKLHGRGYHTDDGSLVQTMGITSGYAAVLVLAMYLNSAAVVQLYRSPEVIWGTVPVMLFWISWMWMQAHRGLMHDDPLVFAVKDRASLAAGLVFALILYAGTRNSLW